MVACEDTRRVSSGGGDRVTVTTVTLKKGEVFLTSPFFASSKRVSPSSPYGHRPDVNSVCTASHILDAINGLFIVYR